MKQVNNKIALIYDFDKTLTTTDVANYNLVEKLQLEIKDFWEEKDSWIEKHKSEDSIMYMYYILDKAKKQNIKLTKDFFKSCSDNVKYFPGVLSWFDNINEYASKLNIEIEHYIISSGLEEIIEGTEIRKYMKDVFACYYAYDDNDEAFWPARVVNTPSKLQYIKAIHKGLKKEDDVIVNENNLDDIAIDYKNMIYIGDGFSDLPAMEEIKNKGGNSILLYNPEENKEFWAKNKIRENVVDFALEADFNKDNDIDITIKEIINNLQDGVAQNETSK